MPAKRSRAPASLKLNLATDCSSNEAAPRQLELVSHRKNSYLVVDDRVMITGVKHAEDL